MEPVKLKTFYDLLLEGKTVAQLATAVETHGVTGWDRFGRFGEFGHPSKSDGAVAALEVLASYFKYEEQFYEDLEAKVSSADGLDYYSASAIDQLENFQSAGVHRFGWPADRVPSFEDPRHDPPVPRHPRRDENPRNALLLLGALLDYVGRTNKRPSQSQVIKDISARYPDVYGLKVAALEKWFAQANQAFRDANA